MDEGPFRMQPSPERRGVSRPAQSARTPEPAQQPVAAEPTVARNQPVPQAKKGPNRLKWPVIILSAIIVGLVGWLVWSSAQKPAAPIEKDQYQAVFFANGNVYFGNLQDINSDYYKMTGVYYPQTQTVADTEAAQKQTNDQSSITLLKLGDAIHGPDDEMLIAKNQVLFYQNLRADSKVSQLIDGQKN